MTKVTVGPQFNVHIEIKEMSDGWWAWVWLFHGTPGEPPLMIGPQPTEDEAKKKGMKFADGIVL